MSIWRGFVTARCEVTVQGKRFCAQQVVGVEEWNDPEARAVLERFLRAEVGMAVTEHLRPAVTATAEAAPWTPA